MKKIFFNLFILIAILNVSYVYTATYNNKNLNLTIDKAVEMANKYNPSLKALKFAIQAQKENEKVAISGYFPTVNLSETPYLQNAQNGLQNKIAVEGRQLVYSFAGPLQQLKIAQKQTDVAKLSEEERKDFLRYFVEASFLQSWLLQRKNKLIKALNFSADEKIKKSEHQNKLDLLDRNTWLQDEATFANSLANVYLYSDDLKNAQNQLEFYIGKQFDNKDKIITLIWDSKQKIKVESLENYYQKAFKNRKDIQRKQKETEAFKETEYYYKKGNAPELRVMGSVSKDSNSYYNNHQVGLYLTWNIFDGGTKHYEQHKAHAEMLKALEEKENLINQAKYDVQKAYNDLAILLKQLAAQNIQLTQAQNDYIFNKQKYEIGDISKVDFEQVKYNWENQKFIWLSLKINTAIKERELQYACGFPE
ncbi:TolC family protein [Candidatus Babeliales bacterium]|nr:TolC family protein [Candidatus Babeliales bacterium]MCF7899618.1 TolC family protein [Candidatus Babeliales bacterium]